MPVEEIEARLNVASDGKRFRCDFIREGPVFYPEINKGIECLRRSTIEKALQSFIGKPLTIEHIDARMNVADPEIFAKVAHGKIDKVGRDAESGWFFCEGDITSDAGREAALGMNPSCGYRVGMTGQGGRWNNVPYERELTQIEFHHLALTSKRPRYEEADIRLNAIQDDQGKPMKFKLLRKLAAAVVGGQPTTEEVELSGDTALKLPSGGEIRLNDAVEAYASSELEKQKAADAEKKKKDDAAAAGGDRQNAVTDDSEVLVDGKPVKVAVLRQAYEARENAAAAETKRKADEARENATRGAADFAKLEAARTAPTIRKDFPQTAGTVQEAMKRGVY